MQFDQLKRARVHHAARGRDGDVIAHTAPGGSRATCRQIGVLTGVFRSSRWAAPVHCR